MLYTNNKGEQSVMDPGMRFPLWNREDVHGYNTSVKSDIILDDQYYKTAANIVEFIEISREENYSGQPFYLVLEKEGWLPALKFCSRALGFGETENGVGELIHAIWAMRERQERLDQIVS